MAEYVVSCPQCSSSLRIAGPLVPGKRLRCPRCQAVFSAAGEEAPPLAQPVARTADVCAPAWQEPSPPAPLPPRRRRPRKARGGSGWKLVVGLLGCGMALLLLAAVGVGFLIWRFWAPSYDWQTFAPSGEGYRIEMPGTPAEMAGAESNPLAGVRTKKYRVLTGRYEFVVGTVHLPAGALQRINTEFVFNAERDHVAQASQSEVVGERDISLGGHVGREFQYATPDRKAGAIERVYLVQQGGVARIHLLAVSGRAFHPEADAVQHFLNSFTVEEITAPATQPGGGPRPGPGPGIPGPGPGLPGAGPGVPGPAPGPRMPEPPQPSRPPADSGKPASVVLSNATVTRERLGVQVRVDFRIEVPRKSPFEKFHLVLKTANGTAYDVWATELESRSEGTIQQRLLRVGRNEQAGPFELYLELRRLGAKQTKAVVSNRLKVAAG